MCATAAMTRRTSWSTNPTARCSTSATCSATRPAAATARCTRAWSRWATPSTGRLKSFRANVGVVLPKQISCRFGYWTLGDTELESNTLTDSPDFPYYSAGTNEIDVVVDQASGRTFHFAGGELVIRFRVFEACAQ